MLHYVSAELSANHVFKVRGCCQSRKIIANEAISQTRSRGPSSTADSTLCVGSSGELDLNIVLMTIRKQSKYYHSCIVPGGSHV